jgi:LysR family glycine cleavage system transcriptional activator
VTVGAISQPLRKAEAELGLQLVERNGRTISLSTLGKQYHTDIKSAFDQIRDASSRVERSGAAPVLTISCLPSLASKWLGARLFDWQTAHPSATVRLIGTDTEPDFATGILISGYPTAI